ncbi:MAG: enoyl-CoA hydratase/isomerase family protein [Lentimicrobiaceae bacterium]|jgi:methylglutaconyl-CoA hydratase|nr:enoyl-CoA hydratase/isomerase family protein [Lentimicrobiaceae bacterium]
MNFETITLKIEHRIATIRLNRPEKHNALNPLMIEELTQVFDTLKDNEAIRVILLKGNGLSFCSGADLNYMREIASFGEAENLADASKLATLFYDIFLCPKVVVAVVHGNVFGGANGLTAACDMVLADENTQFAFTEVKMGITPATISPYIIRRCGATIAAELMLTARKFTAQEAEKYHLVNATFTYETKTDVEQFYVNHLLAAAPNALASCKKLIRTVASLPQEETFSYTVETIAKQRGLDEGIEGMSAFLEKRKPKWMV